MAAFLYDLQAGPGISSRLDTTSAAKNIYIFVSGTFAPTLSSVADPNPDPDSPYPLVFGHPGSGSGLISQRYDPDPDPHQDLS